MYQMGVDASTYMGRESIMHESVGLTPALTSSATLTLLR
jgi:hypothetical protein